MIIKEYRVVLPMTVDEYQLAQLYSVAEASKNETGGGEGIEVIENIPYTDCAEKLADGMTKILPGQYTHKIYHLASKVPGFIRLLAPKGSLEFHEKAWNAYPYCKTVVSNPDYMKQNFVIKIETIHIADQGETENAHNLPQNLLSKREVINLDIALDKVDRKDYKPDEDPTKFKSEKTGRGPLSEKWQDDAGPFMCCYKLVTVEFIWFGLQRRIEKFLQSQYPRLFRNFHRQMFCWMDKWYGMTMDDIREYEDKTKEELDDAIHRGSIRGMVAKE